MRGTSLEVAAAAAGAAGAINVAARPRSGAFITGAQAARSRGAKRAALGPTTATSAAFAAGGRA